MSLVILGKSQSRDFEDPYHKDFFLFHVSWKVVLMIANLNGLSIIFQTHDQFALIKESGDRFTIS